MQGMSIEARGTSIEARGLVKTYPAPGKTRLRALDGLTLSVPRGAIFGLVDFSRIIVMRTGLFPPPPSSPRVT